MPEPEKTFYNQTLNPALHQNAPNDLVQHQNRSGSYKMELNHADGRYAINQINYASGITVYTIEKNGREMKAIALLTDAGYEKLHNYLTYVLVKGTDPYVDLQVDVVPKEQGNRFGLIVGIGDPR